MNKPFLPKWPFLFKLRLLWITILLILVLVLIYLRLVPKGQISYSRQWPAAWHSGQGFISGFQPVARLNLVDQNRPEIIGEPVYFSVRTPRAFDKAKVSIEYSDHLASDTPIIELGLLKDRLTQGYDLQPIQNNLLDNWEASGWQVLSSSSPLILEKGEQYSTAADFERDLNSGHLRGCSDGLPLCLATYNYPVNFIYQAPKGRIVPLKITQDLRGPHQFYLYLPVGPWKLSLNFSYLTKASAATPITVNIWSGSQVIQSKILAPTSANEKAVESAWNQTRSLDFSGNQSQGQLYRVEVNLGSDVALTEINSSSDKLVFIHKIWPINSTKLITLFTDSANLRLQTNNPASLGTVGFGTQDFVLNKAYQPVNLVSDHKINKIILPHQDILLQDNGVFAFNQRSLFNPEIKSINRYFSPEPGLRYIVAGYRPLRSEDGNKMATALFNLAGADRQDKSYHFVISIPGLAGINPDSYLQIKKITVYFQGKNLWRKIGL